MRHLMAVLEDCEYRGTRLAANGDGLEVRGPSTAELREELRYHKPNVFHVLRTGRCHHERPPEECKVCNGYVRRLIENSKTDAPLSAPAGERHERHRRR